MATERKPLDGIRVFDMTRVLAGPYCTALLADLGAEVIKLEPITGDEYRHVGPFQDGESALFLLTNRGKKSISIDLKQEDGLALARDIARNCDVAVENFRPGVAARLGLGPDDLKALKPDIIYASISGFGQTGPWTDLPAYDLVVQAMSGLMAVTGEEGGAPLKVGESFGDLAAGLFASWAILAAVVQHARTGEGSVIDVAMYDTLFSLLPTAHAQYLYSGREPQRVGNRHPLSTPFGCYQAEDGLFAIAVLNDRQFAGFATLIGAPGLEKNPKFANDSARTENEAELRGIIEDWSSRQTVDDLITALSTAHIPCAPIRSIPQAVASPQTEARELIGSLTHPSVGPVPVVSQPVRFDGKKSASDSAAPLLGGDADDILVRLAGRTTDEIEMLRANGIIGGTGVP